MGHSAIEAIILGILQGLTEFLPISSSAHLILLPWLFDWEPLGLTFDVLVHGGTLLALLIYFRQDWVQLIRAALRGWGDSDFTQERTLIVALAVGTVPAALVGLLFADVIEHYLRTPPLITFTLTGFGLWLWHADRKGSQKRNLKSIRPRDGLAVGLAQALALIPGVSRAGVSITAGLVLGLSRAEAARFSFLLGTPIIGGATAKSLYDLWRLPAAEAGLAVPFVLGVVFSFASGFLCIKYFLKFLETHTYAPFVAYRLLLAAFIFFLWFL